MSEQTGKRSYFGKKRRENSPAGTKKRRDLWVTAEEEAMLVARAAREGVTVPRLLIGAATSESVETPAERKQAIAELFTVQRLLANVANNVNQLARHANSGDEFPAEAAATLAYVKKLTFRIEDAVDRLGK
nr:mobilization protein C [Arthrobacter sp.]